MSTALAESRYSLLECDTHRDLSNFADEVRAGLSKPPKTLPCRFLYDERGSQIFEEICELPEYYLTRAEHEILEECSDEIASRFPSGTTLAELGSGSSTKTRLLIEAFLDRHGELSYVPVDISRSMLEESSMALLEDYDELEIRAVASEYEKGLRHVRSEDGAPTLIAWLGSNVGNFERDEAAAFLRDVRRTMEPDDRILVGIDLRKDGDALELAYDDPAGVTARFSLNLLRRINDELGGSFDLDAFSHRAAWNEAEGEVKIDLVSLRDHAVEVSALDLEVPFADGEAIHIESSYKYSLEETEKLADASSLRPDGRWLDSESRFSLNLFAPV